MQYYSLTSFSAESGNPKKNTEEESAVETSPNKLIVYMEEITQYDKWLDREEQENKVIHTDVTFVS